MENTKSPIILKGTPQQMIETPQQMIQWYKVVQAQLPAA